jgi:hypothetical protein
VNILDMTDDQLADFLESGSAMVRYNPQIEPLWQGLTELALRLREIKGLAIEHATKGTLVPADTLIRLLDGAR